MVLRVAIGVPFRYGEGLWLREGRAVYGQKRPEVGVDFAAGVPGPITIDCTFGQGRGWCRPEPQGK